MTQHPFAAAGLSAADQLAAEWAMFEAVDAGAAADGWRLWEADRPVVVAGRTNRIGELVNEDACRADGVPILRRQSGGGAVVLGPGCLNYAVVCSLVSRPVLLDVEASFRLILRQVVERLDVAGVVLVDRADLALDGRKVSGNAQRRGRRALMHHGTILYDFDPALAVRYLTEPSRRPAYRGARTHPEFMGNLPLTGEGARHRVSTALRQLCSPVPSNREFHR